MFCLFSAMIAGTGVAADAGAYPDGIRLAKRTDRVLGCWGDADRGDAAELKLLFVSDGSMIQYDENQEENRKRTFGAWEMEQESAFLTVYWPSGAISAYTVKRIGPILHFSGLNGGRNFTLRLLESDKCWEPKV